MSTEKIILTIKKWTTYKLISITQKKLKMANIKLLL